MNVAKRAIAVLAIASLVLTQSAPVFAQGKSREARGGQGGGDAANFQEMNQFKLPKLEEKWVEYSGDKGFKALVDKAKAMGFKRVADNEKFAWGFGGAYTKGPSEKRMAAEVCAFDFAKQTPDGNVQMASMLWRKVNGEVYKALIIFPVGEHDVSDAFNNGVEFYADAEGNVQQAHSFRTCFNQCLTTSAGFCLGLAALCIPVATAIGLSGAGLPVALGLLGACAGICVLPIAICSVRC